MQLKTLRRLIYKMSVAIPVSDGDEQHLKSLEQHYRTRLRKATKAGKRVRE